MKKPPTRPPHSREKEFPLFILDQLEGMAGLESRPMFGGQGLYSSGTFFGIVWQDRVFFKTNEHSAPQYISTGANYFQPSANQTLKQYFEVPGYVLDRNGELLRWAMQSASV